MGEIFDTSEFLSEGFPSGQRGQTVNLLAQPSKVRILLSPPPAMGPGSSVVERFLGKEKVGSSTLLSGSRHFNDSSKKK